MDFKKLLSVKNIIIAAAALALLVGLTLTLVFCTRNDGGETPDDGDQTGQVTPGETETPNDNTNPDDNTTPDGGNTTPDGGNTNPDGGNTNPDGGETHTHTFVDGKCQCGEDDPNYTPAPSIPEPITYEEYLAMSAEEQEDYCDLFTDLKDFFAWLNAAKAEYEDQKNDATLGEDGSLDMGDIFGD